MLIVVGTSGQISVLLPDLELDPSRRESSSNDFMENFELIQTYNVNSKFASNITDDMFPIMLNHFRTTRLMIGMIF